MGAKTALLAFVTGDVRSALSTMADSDPGAAASLVRRAFPGRTVTADGGTSLWDAVFPEPYVAYAASHGGVDLLADRRLMFGRPSDLPEHLHAIAAGRRIVLHGMHSVSDWLSFAVWEDRRLIRSLSLSPGAGIVENIGEPLDFEAPFWAGEHPVDDDDDDYDDEEDDFDDEPYPFPFHPLELGEEALRSLFGFVREGYPDPADLDAGAVMMHGFRVLGS